MVKLSIGIDIGGTNTAIGVVNQEGKILLEDSILTPPKKLNATANQQVSDKLLNDFISEISKIVKSSFQTYKANGGDMCRRPVIFTYVDGAA